MSDKFYNSIKEAADKHAKSIIKIMKNGPDDKPYCMVQDGKTLMCHKTLKEAQDHMNQMMEGNK